MTIFRDNGLEKEGSIECRPRYPELALLFFVWGHLQQVFETQTASFRELRQGIVFESQQILKNARQAFESRANVLLEAENLIRFVFLGI